MRSNNFQDHLLLYIVTESAKESGSRGVNSATVHQCMNEARRQAVEIIGLTF